MHRVFLVVVLALSGCATLKPVGEPGPIACVSADSAIRAWLELDKYMRQVLDAQQNYSCGPVASAALAAPPPVVPPLR